MINIKSLQTLGRKMRNFSEYLNEVLKLKASPFAALTDQYVNKIEMMGQKTRRGVRLAGAYIDLTPFAGTVVINEISLPPTKQGQGAGHKAMKVLTDLADEMGVKLQLFAKPIDQGPGNEKIPQKKLTAFYKKHGFKGIGKMIRDPK